MISDFIRPRLLAAGIAACLAATAAQAGPVATGSVRAAGASLAANSTGKTYIVMFSEPSVALRNRALRSAAATTTSSAQTIPFTVKPNGRASMDMRSDAARSYRASIVAAQADHQRSIESSLGRSVPFARTFQHAINGATMVLSDGEAARVRTLPGVVAVVPSRTIYPDDDVSSRFIGADVLWRGNNRRAPAPGFTYPTLDSLFGDLNEGSGYKGDGVVIGVIDTGYNSLSPSFQATDASGYKVTNPLGSGTYIGDCNVSSISFGGCNDKVIAVYDSYKRGLGKTGSNVEDTNGHGSHTASTAGGNGRSGNILSFNANISGIAPHANLAIFRIVTPGVGTATDVSELSAIEDAISDQVVDVLNMSFGGCSEPSYWGDPVSLAFLAAQDANIFAALSAGNTRPVTQCARQATQSPGTVGNAMPWVTTVAATTPPAGEAALQLNLTGPGTPPDDTQGISLTEGTYDTPLSTSLPANTPIVLSPQFDAGDPGSPSAPSHGADGCVSYPAHKFDGAIALISRGTCSFSVKVANAISAGAIAAVISDNRAEGPFSPTVGPPLVNIPVFSVAQSDGLALQSYLGTAGGKGTAALGYPDARPAGQADVLAGFSLVGPVLTPVPFNVIKPDIAAPGVGTLASIANAFETAEGQVVQSDNPNIVGFESGTSMASPHIAGAAALLVQAHPDWSAAEIRSALMMTAAQTVTKPDGVTPADVYDVGAGRVQVDKAAAAGLVLGETSSNFLAGDPTQGGDASTFNIASMQNFNCAGTCIFTRTFRSTQSTDVTWTASLAGQLAGAATVTPSTFTVPAGGTVKLTVTVDARGLLAGAGYTTGSLQISPPAPLPGYQPLSGLHLPISVAVPAPALATSGNVVNIDLGGKASGSTTLNFSNVGGGTVGFAPQSIGTAPLVWIDQKDNQGYYNFTSTHYLNPGKDDLDQFLADDFVISGSNVDLATISTPGAAVHRLSSFGSSLALHWRIYADNNGVPGSQATWSYDATAGGAGVSVAGDTIRLDLVAAGQSTGLAAGRYWLVVYPDLPCNDKGDGNGCTEGWSWNTSWYGNGTNWAYISSDPTDQWSTAGTNWYGPGLAMTITTRATCGSVPAWLTLNPADGGFATAPKAVPVTFTATSAGYAPSSSASTYVCFSSGYQDPASLSRVPQAPIAIQVNAKN